MARDALWKPLFLQKEFASKKSNRGGRWVRSCAPLLSFESNISTESRVRLDHELRGICFHNSGNEWHASLVLKVCWVGDCNCYLATAWPGVLKLPIINHCPNLRPLDRLDVTTRTWCLKLFCPASPWQWVHILFLSLFIFALSMPIAHKGCL